MTSGHSPGLSPQLSCQVNPRASCCKILPGIVCGQQKDADSNVYSRKLLYFLMNYSGLGGLNESVAEGACHIALVLAPPRFLLYGVRGHLFKGVFGSLLLQSRQANPFAQKKTVLTPQNTLLRGIPKEMGPLHLAWDLNRCVLSG